MKRLEKNQKIVLAGVAELGGIWKAGTFVFGTNHRTENVLVSLSQIGLAEKKGTHRDFGVFCLTLKGQQIAATL